MSKKSSYWQLIPYLGSEISTIALAFLCTIGFTIFWPILASLAGSIANYIGQGNTGAIARLAGVTALVFLIRGAVQYGQDVLMAKAALKIAHSLRQAAYRHLQSLSLDYFSEAKTGDLAYRLTEDIDRIGEVINKVFHQFIPCILQLIVVLGYMFYLNWQLTIASLIIAPIMALLIGFFGEQLLKFTRRSQAKISNLSALITEVLAGIRLVQAFNAQEYEIQRFAQESEQNRRLKFLAEKSKAMQFVVVGFLEAMSVLFLFFLGGWQISQNNLTPSEFVSYVAAVALLIDPISITTSNYNEFKQGEASVDRFFELITIPTQISDHPDATPIESSKGKIEYHNLTFAYNPENPVLHNINFVANPGEMIALVGASGAGKSTLINLLLRFHEPQQGKILLDGYNTQKFTLNSLRKQIGLVPQDTLLFSGTIAENIAFGQQEIDIKQVESAAKIANAHQFISQLSQGYSTYIGERGVNLSGGQRQRIAIARAIFFNPKILIFDEATSALDSESEYLVQQALEKINQDRTLFVIAHRLATVRKATKIIVLEKGEIIEVGTHRELLAKNGKYAQFYERQFHQN